MTDLVTHACVCWTRKGLPCPIPADRLHEGGWFCHVHDPAGLYQFQQFAFKARREDAKAERGSA